MERYVIRGGETGYDRLGVLAAAWHDTTFELLDRAGLRTGMTCLDLGCGGGHVTRDLARRVGPAGHVVGVDMDPVKLELAQRAADEQGLSNVEFRELNVYDWDERDRYDLAYCRNLLQHVSRPLDVTKSMWAGVRPGGVLVIEDADFEGAFCDPPSEAYDFWDSAYQQVLARHGGDPLSGRKLHRRFLELGIPGPTTTVVQRVDITGDAKLMPYLTILATADAILAEGLATRERLESILAELRAGAEDPTLVWGSPRLFQTWARKPTS